MSGGNSSSDDDEGWGSKFLKVAGAAAVAGGLYALLRSSSSSNSNQQSPFESRESRVIKDPDDDDETSSPENGDDDDDDDDDETPSPQNDDDDDDDETQPSQIRWTKLELGWVKLNVDGSCDHISRPRSAGCSGVLKDSSCTWLLGFAQKMDASFDSHVTEIEAILKGLELAFDMNVKKLVVESDSEPVMSMVENGLGAKYNHPQFNIMKRIRDFRFDPKWEVKVVHVAREANRVANKLAKGLLGLPISSFHFN